MFTSPEPAVDVDTKSWFESSCAVPHEKRSVEVDGTRIAYRCWGDPALPVLLLVHGLPAHSGWWDHVAPHLADSFRVLALDLSGHGDSGWRHDYSHASWADDVMGVAEAEGAVQALIVGHSTGGHVALTVARRYGSRLRGLIAIDCPVREPEDSPIATSRRPRKIYRSKTEILGRFRTIPQEPQSLPYVLDYLAKESVTEVGGGWSWKFDQWVFSHRRFSVEQLGPVDCPVTLVPCGNGIFDQENVELTARLLATGVVVHAMPDAGHHVMLDHPVELVADLQHLLSSSVPDAPAATPHEEESTP